VPLLACSSATRMVGHSLCSGVLLTVVQCDGVAVPSWWDVPSPCAPRCLLPLPPYYLYMSGSVLPAGHFMVACSGGASSSPCCQRLPAFPAYYSGGDAAGYICLRRGALRCGAPGNTATCLSLDRRSGTGTGGINGNRGGLCCGGLCLTSMLSVPEYPAHYYLCRRCTFYRRCCLLLPVVLALDRW